MPHLESVILTNNSLQELADLVTFIKEHQLMDNPDFILLKKSQRLDLVFLLLKLRLLEFVGTIFLHLKIRLLD